MKLFIITFMIFLTAGCENYSSKEPLLQISKLHDPESFDLQDGWNSYVSRTELKDGTEIGIIRMEDGSSAKYWFRSHHWTDDMGGTWFLLSDGLRIYMAGWFCCELQLPKRQLKSLSELKEFIRKHHGHRP